MRPGAARAGPWLLLTTTGCRSGRQGWPPLQYERVDGSYVVASARGAQADWFRNAVAEPYVTVRVGDRTLTQAWPAPSRTRVRSRTSSSCAAVGAP